MPAPAKIFAFEVITFAFLLTPKSLTSQQSSMFASRSAVTRFLSTSARSMSTKVAVLGAAGGIGQPLSMLLKLSPAVDELSCYDVRGSPGVAADLSHVRS
jgi:malate dehydrogenase